MNFIPLFFGDNLLTVLKDQEKSKNLCHWMARIFDINQSQLNYGSMAIRFSDNMQNLWPKKTIEIYENSVMDQLNSTGCQPISCIAFINHWECSESTAVNKQKWLQRSFKYFFYFNLHLFHSYTNRHLWMSEWDKIRLAQIF